MSCVDIRSGPGATKIAIVLEENGAVVCSYGLTPKVRKWTCRGRRGAAAH